MTTRGPRQIRGSEPESSGDYTTQVNGSTSANTWSSYTQLISSTTRAYNALHITIGRTSSTQSSVVWAVKIAFGGAGSEVDVIPGLIHYDKVSFWTYRTFPIPIYVPAGTRISASIRLDKATISTPQIRVGVIGFSIHGWGGERGEVVTSYGTTFDASNTIATTIDPGGTANTFNTSVTQITGSCARRIRYLIANHYFGYPTTSSGIWSYKIEKGIGISPNPVIDGLNFNCNANIDIATPSVHCCLVPTPIPAGTRIVANAKSNVTALSTRVFDLQLLGIG